MTCTASPSAARPPSAAPRSPSKLSSANPPALAQQTVVCEPTRSRLPSTFTTKALTSASYEVIGIAAPSEADRALAPVGDAEQDGTSTLFSLASNSSLFDGETFELHLAKRSIGPDFSLGSSVHMGQPAAAVPAAPALVEGGNGGDSSSQQSDRMDAPEDVGRMLAGLSVGQAQCGRHQSIFPSFPRMPYRG